MSSERGKPVQNNVRSDSRRRPSLKVALLGLLISSPLISRATTEVAFNPPVKGSEAQITPSRDGGFYIVSPKGGANNVGQIVRITPAGAVSKLVDFTVAPGCAGEYSPLVEGRDGNLYGTSMCTGDADKDGRVYRITPGGSLVDVIVFNGQLGKFPTGLTLARDGSFYGTTRLGGAYGQGTIFQLSAAGELKIIYSFQDSEGHYPMAPVIEGADGNLYGTTSQGGAEGHGTAFKVTPSGTLTALGDFTLGTGSSPPSYPNGLIQAADGSLYGTIQYGGKGAYLGSLFKVNPAGGITVLVQFNGASEGGLPNGLLVAGADGAIYGTTSCALSCGVGGQSTGGTVFQLLPNGALRDIGAFPKSAGTPGPLVLGADGKFYGGITLQPSGILQIYRVRDLLLPPPTGLAAVVGDSSLALSWIGIAGAAGYKIYSGTSPQNVGVDPIATVSAENVTIGGLANGTTYYFRVSAYDAASTSIPSPLVNQTPVGRPNSPALLSALPADGGVKLTWVDQPSVYQYDVLMGLASGQESSSPVRQAPSGTFTTVAGLTNGTTYYFKIMPRNVSGTGPLSNELSVTPKPADAPSQVTATGFNGGISLAWAPVANASRYRVFQLAGPGGRVTSGTFAALNSFTVTGLVNGQAYYFKVGADDPLGHTGPIYSQEVTATPHP